MTTTEQVLRIRVYLDNGLASAGWYDETKWAARTLLGQHDGDLFLRIIAATSANATVAANVSLAFKAMAQLKNGQAFDGFLPSVKKNLINILLDQPLQGPKISAFERALTGDPNAVVIDRWILRAWGYKSLTPTRRSQIIDDIHFFAYEYGLEPRQVQAAIWFGIKKDHGGVSDADDPFEFHIFKRVNDGLV